MTNVAAIVHPLIEDHLVTLRNQSTSSSEFRAATRRLAFLVGYEATRDLPLQSVSIQTPVAQAHAKRLATRLALIPILRAGLGLVDPLLDLIPSAQVYHLGLYRDEETAQPVRYYDKLPSTTPPNTALVLDPMLATGGSIALAIERMQAWGVDDIRVLSLIGSQVGIDRITKRFPNVRIYVAAIDPELNQRNYIVPGLGDAGDRQFNT
jgi:uracil phosphoribosyltransferase